MTKVYRFIHDSCHGWLEVSLDDLGQLDLIDKVSAFSHMSADRQTIYLEEDCDVPLFMDAKGAVSGKGDMRVWHDQVCQKSFVQELEHYALKAA